MRFLSYAFVLILLLAIGSCAMVLTASINEASKHSKGDVYAKYEDGYYVVSTTDNQKSFFCKNYYPDKGIVGTWCKDMTCKFAADRRVTIERIFLEDAVVMKTYDFQWELVSCGSKVK